MHKTATLKYLTPRFLGTLLVLLIFSFVFETSADSSNLTTILLSLVPGTLVLLLLIIAWTKQGIGGWFFIVLGVLSILYTFSQTVDFTWGLLFLPGWAITVGILFLVGKK